MEMQWSVADRRIAMFKAANKHRKSGRSDCADYEPGHGSRRLKRASMVEVGNWY